MTTILLIRHGRHDLLGRVLTGRAAGVHLNATGLQEARELVSRLDGIPIDALYSSPMERTLETAAPLAEAWELEIRGTEEFNEIDFGAWTSLSFSELDRKPEWQTWNEARDRCTPPDGETMAAVMERASAGLDAMARAHPDSTIAVFSHGDVIKGAIMRCLGIPINNHARLDVSPASISVIIIDQQTATVLAVNRAQMVVSLG